MEKKDLIKEINVSLMRLGMYFSEDTRSFLWELGEEELILILRFCGYMQRFYRRAK